MSHRADEDTYPAFERVGLDLESGKDYLEEPLKL
jgi:hypothetical protein